MVANPLARLGPVEPRIVLIRGQKVLLDRDLAELYGVPPKVFNQAVKRNIERFPEDFMFQLTWAEANQSHAQVAGLDEGGHVLSRSQIVTLKRGTNIKYRPYAFTEHGAIMAASVLNSPRAVEVSVYVVRAFVKLRELLASNKQLAKKLDELERKLSAHDKAIVQLVEAIRQLMTPPETKKRPIGFVISNEK